MSRKKPRVHYQLDSSGITHLPDNEVKAILRAAHWIIGMGGRSMLTKILKGSKDKKILEYELDLNPAYGFYRHLSLPEISKRVDWTIENDYLVIQYGDRLPLIIYSYIGWEIEKETYTEELLQILTALLGTEEYHHVENLKDMDRGLILLLLEKIKSTGNSGFIPLLKAWQEIDYKKVKIAIQGVINYLENKKSN